MKNVIIGIAIGAMTSGPAAATTLADNFSGYFAFGDSLSDPGNFLAAVGGTWPEGFPYFGSTFSNGPTFAQGISEDFDPADVSNYAYGFAEAANPGPEPLPEALALHFDEQVELFLAETGGSSTGALMTVLFGANDLLEALGPRDAVAPSLPNPELDLVIAGAVEAVFEGVAQLVSTGPKQIIVLDLPDLGLIPRYFFDDGQAIASYAAAAFNSAISSIGNLSTETTTVSLFSLNAFFGGLLSDPLAAGISDFSPCVLNPAAVAAGCPGFLFYDDVHPTAAVHGLAADAIAATVPVPASLPLLLAGLGGLLLARRGAIA